MARRALSPGRDGRRLLFRRSDRGEFSGRSRVTLHEYSREWVERYQGRGRRGFREHTRTEYRSALNRFALEYFPPLARD